MLLFTKPGCGKCNYVKSKVNLEEIGVREAVLSEDNPGALAELAWFELVDVAEKKLPLLVFDNNYWTRGIEDSYISDAVRITKYLKNLAAKTKEDELMEME